YTTNSEPSAPTPLTPANGAEVRTTTPTLTVSPATDPNGDQVWYFFHVSNNPDAETDATAVYSGWSTQPTYTVRPGALQDGVVYYWHAYTYDYIGSVATIGPVVS